LIDTGSVLVSGALATKSARLVDPAEPLVVMASPPKFVSRGGQKLEHALTEFGLEVTGLRALDIGASTGGFTDCLLQYGAAEVVALDVGHGQLDARLRADPRVVVLERVHVRDLTTDLIGGPVDIVTCDVSFISLRHVVGPALAVCRPGAVLVMLVKPQFEAGRVEVSRGRGVITDPKIWEMVTSEISDLFLERGCRIAGIVPSPILGGSGNREFLLVAEAPARGESSGEI
jgi:23S rRNA (cytidine1920-2'-O)/16S rRNA (cytidine1409-2'-O)-methyltransferase